MSVSDLRQYIRKVWQDSFQSINRQVLGDIYAFSFYLYAEEDDPRVPVLIIGYNTNIHLNKQLERASDDLEAKWNYAFWLQNQIAAFGQNDNERLMIGNWLSSCDLGYTDSEEAANFDLCIEKGERITQEFINVLIEIVRDFFEDYPDSPPIIIHQLEYHDGTRDQTVLANGLERAREFSNWITEMYS